MLMPSPSLPIRASLLGGILAFFLGFAAPPASAQEVAAARSALSYEDVFQEVAALHGTLAEVERGRLILAQGIPGVGAAPPSPAPMEDPGGTGMLQDEATMDPGSVEGPEGEEMPMEAPEEAGMAPEGPEGEEMPMEVPEGSGMAPESPEGQETLMMAPEEAGEPAGGPEGEEGAMEASGEAEALGEALEGEGGPAMDGGEPPVMDDADGAEEDPEGPMEGMEDAEDVDPAMDGGEPPVMDDADGAEEDPEASMEGMDPAMDGGEPPVMDDADGADEVSLLDARSLEVVDAASLGPLASPEKGLLDMVLGSREILESLGLPRELEALSGVIPSVDTSVLEEALPPASRSAGDMRADDFGDVGGALDSAQAQARALLEAGMSGIEPPAVLGEQPSPEETLGWIERGGREVQLMRTYGDIFEEVATLHGTLAALRASAVGETLAEIERQAALVEGIEQGRRVLDDVGQEPLAVFSPSEILLGEGAGVGVVVVQATRIPVDMGRVAVLVPEGPESLRVLSDGCVDVRLGPGSSCVIAYVHGAEASSGSMVLKVSDAAGRGFQSVAVPIVGEGFAGIRVAEAEDSPGVELAPDREFPEDFGTGTVPDLDAPPPSAPLYEPAQDDFYYSPEPRRLQVGLLAVSRGSGGLGMADLVFGFGSGERERDRVGGVSEGDSLPWGGKLLVVDVEEEQVFLARPSDRECRGVWPGMALLEFLDRQCEGVWVNMTLLEYYE